MPSERRTLTPELVDDTIAACFRAQPGQMCGIELEWPVHPRDDVRARPAPDVLLAAAAHPLPGGSRVTIEPGGQIELSTLPAAAADDVLDVATSDASALHRRLAAAELDISERALDTLRPPLRILGAARYRCMEAHFAVSGEAGSWMMCNTASLQVNLGHEPADPDRRWSLAHRLGPVLIATFANSPGLDAAGRRWESLRQAIWWSIDPGRTRPPRDCVIGSRSGTVPAAQAWRDYALAADVMIIRSLGGGGVNAPRGFCFGQWMTTGHPIGWPTLDDLHYHLTTLFPPVRPRGWLELRMLDLLPPGTRDVATLVVLAALSTEAANDLETRIPDTSGLWCTAARHALAHPGLAEAARILFDTITQTLPAVSGDRSRLDAAAAFADRHVRRSLSPAQLVRDAELAGRLAPDLDPRLVPAAS